MFAAKDRLPYNATASRQPGTFAAPACLLQTSDRSSPDCSCPQEPRRRRVSSLPTLLPAQNFQPSHFQSLPHSLQQEQKLTPAFPSASGLFLRSCAQERKLTPLFSCIPALFGETTGEGGGIFTSFSGCGLYLEPAQKRVWAVLAARAIKWTLTQDAPLTRAECALPRSLDLKPRAMNTYKNGGRG